MRLRRGLHQDDGGDGLDRLPLLQRVSEWPVADKGAGDAPASSAVAPRTRSSLNAAPLSATGHSETRPRGLICCAPSARKGA